MIYEFIATITAGFGMAGIALIIRHLCKLVGKTAPKWLIPVFAGMGMLIFQIHQEYHWHEQQISRLPDGVKVLKTIEGQVWYRPWSYLKPQVIRFMAVSKSVDVADTTPDIKDDIKLIDIYLFERRMSTKVIRQQVNCSQATYRIMSHTSSVSVPAVANTDKVWHSINKTDELYKSVCD